MNKIYLFVCFIYNSVFSFYEKTYLLKKKFSNYQSQIYTEGYELINFKNQYINLFHEKEINMNNYMKKYILNRKDIYKSLSKLFNEYEFKKIITEKTGYNYSIDYIICYTTFKIPNLEKDKDLYANKWHNDKPFTKNTLKLIIPLNESNDHNGGIEILNKKQTKKFKMGKFNIDEKYFIMKSKLNHILLFFPNLCFHKAGNPNLEEGRKQIMIQLNPSKKWCLNKNIYEKQFKIEPKFPYFNYFFDEKIEI